MIPIVSSSFGPTGVNGQIAPVRRIFANATVSVLATSTTARACWRDHRLNEIKLSDFFTIINSRDVSHFKYGATGPIGASVSAVDIE